MSFLKKQSEHVHNSQQSKPGKDIAAADDGEVLAFVEEKKESSPAPVL